MKTRSTPEEPPNIAAGVKARRCARLGSPAPRTQGETQADEGGNPQPSSTTAGNAEESGKSRPSEQKQPIKSIWTVDDRRLFFQGVRLYGRNFGEIARFIRSRGHRSDTATGAGANQPSTSAEVSGANNPSKVSTVVAPVAAAAGLLPSSSANQAASQSGSGEGKTKEQVRMLYQQTWHKLRRYIKYSDDVPLHAREIYALVNWSAMRDRIKKPLDNRLGEKLNELVHFGSTCVKHHGRRFLLRTPVCPILKQLNHISAPTQDFTLPDDVWIELVPCTQMVAWRVLEAEQNPRVRLKVDINRQLSDVISLMEAKWILPAELMRSALCPNVGASAAAATASETTDGGGVAGERRRPPHQRVMEEQLQVRLPSEQRLDGAISVAEVSRTRASDVALNAFLFRRRAAETATATAPAETASAGEAAATSTATAEGANVSDVAGPLTTIPRSQDEQLPPPPPPLPPLQQNQRNACGLRPNTTGVRLDLHEIGQQLFKGVTYEEARGIKIVVIYLALGCPARIRFEYDFVYPGGLRPSAVAGLAPYPLSLSREATANGEGITNGLRRLLQLSSSEYLSLKTFDQPARSNRVGPSTDVEGDAPDNAEKRKKASSKQPKVVSSAAEPKAQGSGAPSASEEFRQLHPPPSEHQFAMPAPRHQGGHEVVLVGDGGKTGKVKMAIMRQLDVQPSSAVPQPGPSARHLVPRVPLDPTSSPGVPPILPAPPQLQQHKQSMARFNNSLDVLREYSRQQRALMSARRRQQRQMQQMQLQQRQIASESQQHQQESSPSPVPMVAGAVEPGPSTSFGGGCGDSQGGNLSLPFSSNVSTNDSIKSLLDAFMANAPPELELSTPTKEVIRQQEREPLPSYLHFAAGPSNTTVAVVDGAAQQHHQYHFQPDGVAVVVAPTAAATTDMMHEPPHPVDESSSSSLTRFFNSLTAEQNSMETGVSQQHNTSDSLQEKIYQDMMLPPGNSAMDGVVGLHNEYLNPEGALGGLPPAHSTDAVQYGEPTSGFEQQRL